ncbi:MAG: hypothetical protein NTZ56_00990 [Acidobacteria bacterium]|nr:hypothetical protein [Acidobacteriota bacterium]
MHNYSTSLPTKGKWVQTTVSGAKAVKSSEIGKFFDWNTSNRVECPNLKADLRQLNLWANRKLTHPGCELKLLADDEGMGQHCYMIGYRLSDSPEAAKLITHLPVAVVALFAGCFGGGAIIHYAPGFLESLDDSRTQEDLIEASRTMVANAKLGHKRDEVGLSDLQIEFLEDGTVAICFQAKTHEYHAVSGSVCHVFLVKGNEIRVIQAGMGGRGFISQTVNNVVALAPFGIWPTFKRNLEKVVTNEALLKDLNALDLEARQQQFVAFVKASTSFSKKTFDYVISTLGSAQRHLQGGKGEHRIRQDTKGPDPDDDLSGQW